MQKALERQPLGHATPVVRNYWISMPLGGLCSNRTENWDVLIIY